MKIKSNVKAGDAKKASVEIQAWTIGVKSPYDVATGHSSGK
jgi:hypothetical protein